MTGKANIRDPRKRKIREASRNSNINFTQSRGTQYGNGISPASSSPYLYTEGDLNLNTYDIINVDRMLFATAAGSGDTVAVTDYGIEAIASGTSTPYGLTYQIPAGKIHSFKAGTDIPLTISDSYVVISKPLTTVSINTGQNTIQFTETSTPSSVDTNSGKIYAKDVSGVTTPMWYDGTTETSLLGGGSSGWVGTATSDLNMSDYDINTLDRLLFSTTGTDNLATTDYGIATDSANTDNLHYNVPSGKNHKFDVAGTQVLSVNGLSGVTAQIGLWVAGSLTATGTVNFQGDIELGSATNDDITMTGTVDSDIIIAGSKKVKASSSSEIGHYVTNATSAVGSEGTQQIPSYSGIVGNAADCDAKFGSEIGCIGLSLNSGTTPWFCIKIATSGSSQWFKLQMNSGSTYTGFYV
jgi:hypothetical protein